MFDFVRKNTKIMMAMLFLLIIPSFVLFGIEGYMRFDAGSQAVAKVGGQEITQAEWDAAHRQEVDRMRASMPTLDAAIFDSPQARYGTLEGLVQQRVLQSAADKSRLFTSDQRLARALQENPTIASMRKPDGSLDVERYRQLLGSQGMSPEMYESRLRNELSSRQVIGAVTSSATLTPALADTALNAFFQRREVQVARFERTDFTARVSLTDADLEAYYKANLALFQSPERAIIEYVTLDVASLEQGVSLNEADVKTYFEQNATQLSGKEERRASHILINAPKTASEGDRQKAKARAEELLAQLKKAPDSFAEVAKKNSQDTGSAAAGGDLDFFSRGAMVKPFEDAVYAMKKGDISDLVESEFGYHIIRLTDVRAPKQRSFAEARGEIETTLRAQQAQRKFAEAADTFTNTVYEQSDSLKPVIEKLKLLPATATLDGRAAASGAKGALANAKFLKAIFSPDAIEKKRNTEAIELGPNQLVSGRVTSYSPARTLPLAEVQDRVREQLTVARAAELAKKEGETKLAAWKANPTSAILPAAIVLSRDQQQPLPPELVAAALRADLATPPAWVGVDLGERGYAVLKVNKNLTRDATPQDRVKQDRGQYGEWWSTAEGLAYYQLLKARFKAQITVAKPATDLTPGAVTQ